MPNHSATGPSHLSLDGLNPEQHQAVTHGAGPLLVIAGPGSGKTRVITHRIAWLVQEQGIYPSRILAVTFTNRAAREMRSRIEPLIGVHEARRLWAGTFHSICSRLLRENGKLIGIPDRFVIYDADDQLQVIRRSIKEVSVDPREYPPREIRRAISSQKSKGVRVEEFQPDFYYDEVVRRIWELYEQELHAAGALDFDDLLTHGRRLCGLGGERASHIKRFEHTLVDEFQDTNDIQYDLARLWGTTTKNICVVGDPDQAIYSWRGAVPSNLNHFLNDHPGATTIQLHRNYRSTQQILEVANAIMRPARAGQLKELVGNQPDGPKPVRHETENETTEAGYVADAIENLKQNTENLHTFSDIAILYRTNAQSRAFEVELQSRNIPHILIGAAKFFDRREVRDLIAYMRLVRNPADGLAFRRVVNVPPRGVGNKSLLSITQWAELHDKSLMDAAISGSGVDVSGLDPPQVSAKAGNGLARFVETLDQARRVQASQPLIDALQLIIEGVRYEEYIQRGDSIEAESRLDNVAELLNVASRYSEYPPGSALDSFLEDVALYSDQDELPDVPPDAVTLVTLHQAKGLEFPIVFLVGCDEGLIPHARSQDDEPQLEEERRLCYVGVTRAERMLSLLHTDLRTTNGLTKVSELSRFIADVPDELLQISRGNREITRASVGTDVRPAGNRHLRWLDFDPEPAPPPAVGLREGDAVSHEVFGEGVVVGLRTIGRDAEVTVRFADIGVKKLLASMANLSRA